MSSSPPSRVRYLVVFAAMLMAVLLYLDRFCVGLAADYIREDFGLSQKQMGWFLGAFFYSYALAQVPSGWLSDRFGARIMLVIYILSWSFFTAMIGAVASFLMLMVARLGCGLGQAGAYPTSASIVSKWMRFSERGMGSAIISFGGRVGGAVAPLLTAVLIVHYVPAETPMEFTAEQILDAKTLAEKLSSAKKATAAGVIYGALSPEAQQQLARFAETDENPPDAKSLAAGLNHAVLSEGFYDAKAFNDPSIKLVREALAFIERQRDDEELSKEKTKRFHRLLIEGVFPGEVGKLYTAGWRPVMKIYGIAGIAVAVLFWMLVRDRPESHPWCNKAECERIASDRPANAPSPHGKPGNVPWKQLLQSRSLWLCSLLQVGTNIGWVFLVTWLPRYLVDVHQVPILERGLMTSVPLMVGIAGMLVGGKLTDVMVIRVGIRWGRALPMIVTRFIAAAGYLLVFGLAMLPTDSPLNTPWMYIGALSMVAFATDLGTASVWAFNQDVGGRYVGSILGWGNMWGNLGAGLSPPLIYDFFLGESPRLSDWNAMFLVCAGAFVLSGLCGFGIDASRPIAPEDQPD